MESQKQAPGPGNAASRRSRSSSGAGTQSPARRPRPTKKASEDLTAKDANGDGPTNPDPAVFEAAFVIDDTDETATSTRAATPLSVDKEGKTGDSGKDAGKVAGDAPGNGAADPTPNADNGEADRPDTEQTARVSRGASAASSELPPEVRARLRKLDKLEKTYPGSYHHSAPSLGPSPGGPTLTI